MPAFLSRVSAIVFSLSLACAGAQAATLYGVDLKGNPVRDLAGSSASVVVLIFAASDCPISNRYVPEIARLNRAYAGHGVRFWWVFPNPEDTAAIVAQHQKDFSIGEPAILDEEQSLVHLAHASVTPEAAVFRVQGGELHEMYHGRIDDRYESIGTERPQAGQHDLETAITAALGGSFAELPSLPPVGCAIVPRGK